MKEFKQGDSVQILLSGEYESHGVIEARSPHAVWVPQLDESRDFTDNQVFPNNFPPAEDYNQDTAPTYETSSSQVLFTATLKLNPHSVKPLQFVTDERNIEGYINGLRNFGYDLFYVSELIYKVTNKGRVDVYNRTADISKFSTAQLQAELSKREGVTTHVIPYDPSLEGVYRLEGFGEFVEIPTGATVTINID